MEYFKVIKIFLLPWQGDRLCMYRFSADCQSEWSSAAYKNPIDFMPWNNALYCWEVKIGASRVTGRSSSLEEAKESADKVAAELGCIFLTEKVMALV